MQRLLFHCGSAKTGSTAIQWQLYMNDKALRKKGIFYCPRFLKADNVDPLNHCLRRLKFETRPFERKEIIGLGRRRLQQLYDEGFHTVILSNESAFGDPFHDRKSGFFPYFRDVAPYVADMFERVDVVPIFAVRNMASLLPSYYVQRIRQGGTYRESEYFGRLPAEHCSWEPVVEALITLFPSEHRRLAAYEWMVRQDMSLGEAMFGPLLPSSLLKRDRGRPSNSSTGVRALAVMRLMNKLGEQYAEISARDAGIVKRHLRNKLFPVVERLGGAKPVLDEASAAAFSEQYQKDLQALGISI